MRSHAPILQFLPRSCPLGGTKRETSDPGPFTRLEVILDACFVARRGGVCNEEMLQLLQPSASWCLAGAAGKVCWEQGHLVPAATPVPHKRRVTLTARVCGGGDGAEGRGCHERPLQRQVLDLCSAGARGGLRRALTPRFWPWRGCWGGLCEGRPGLPCAGHSRLQPFPEGSATATRPVRAQPIRGVPGG